MSFSSSNTTSGINCYQNEPIVDESTPLIREVVPVNYTGTGVVAVAHDDEEAQCLTALPDKQPQQEPPKNVAGVISILLLGTEISWFKECWTLKLPARGEQRTYELSTCLPILTNTWTHCIMSRCIYRKCRRISCYSHQWDHQQRLQ